jgi:hypothetical protein
VYLSIFWWGKACTSRPRCLNYLFLISTQSFMLVLCPTIGAQRLSSKIARKIPALTILALYHLLYLVPRLLHSRWTVAFCMILVPNSESTEISLEIVNSILKMLVAEHYLVMHSLLTRVFVIIPHQRNYRDKVQQAICLALELGRFSVDPSQISSSRPTPRFEPTP